MSVEATNSAHNSVLIACAKDLAATLRSVFSRHRLVLGFARSIDVSPVLVRDFLFNMGRFLIK